MPEGRKVKGRKAEKKDNRSKFQVPSSKSGRRGLPTTNYPLQTAGKPTCGLTVWRIADGRTEKQFQVPGSKFQVGVVGTLAAGYGLLAAGSNTFANPPVRMDDTGRSPMRIGFQKMNTLFKEEHMRKLMTLIILLLAIAGWSYDQIIPVVAKAAGAQNSQWLSELTLFNAGKKAVDVTLEYLPLGIMGQTPVRTVTLQPGALFDQADILGWFNVQGTGSLTVRCADEARTSLGVQSRTYAVTEAGTFGQAVPAIPVSLIPSGKAELFLILPPDPVKERFNFGIRTLGATSVTWQYLAADGTLLGQVDKAYAGEVIEQYNAGAGAFFGTNQQGRLVKGVLNSGQAILYASRVDNGTNDGVFMTAQPLQSNQPPVFVGVDAAGDGSINYADANGDGVLDTPIPFSTSFLFNYNFTIVASDPEGDPVTVSLRNPPTGMKLISASDGTVYYAPSPQDINKTINLLVDISDGFSTTTETLPLKITP